MITALIIAGFIIGIITAVYRQWQEREIDRRIIERRLEMFCK